MKFAKTVFLVAGFYGFIDLGVAWQILFLLIARDPIRFRPAMIPCVIEKIPFGIGTISLYLAHRVSVEVTVLSCIDLLLAALFIMSFVKTGAASRRAA